MNLHINDTFNKELPADKSRENSPRQVLEACYSFVRPKVPSNPSLIHVSKEMLQAIGLNDSDAQREDFLAVFSGAKVLEGSDPYSMCYGGHQFGHWAGQLGDGRAINLTEVVHKDQRWALQLKGAGETPYSRRADGLAVLRSSIREHLCSEAMYHLGVPTTRSLSLCLTGDEVLRDVMYDGHPAYEKGAVVCRVAPSFIRFGNFQIFASRNDVANLKKLTDYTIKHFFPSIKGGTKESYIEFFNAVLDKTLAMIIDWQRVGFVHGVMNTDNLSILGLTIDYGPYGWLEGYDPNWTPNTTDRQQSRYRYGNQPSIGLWNLYQLANALFLLVEDAKPFENALERYKTEFGPAKTKMMRAKLGLASPMELDVDLFETLEDTLVLVETDMTIFFRRLAAIEKSTNTDDALSIIKEAFYPTIEDLPEATIDQWKRWLQNYIDRLQKEERSDEDRKTAMNLVNPKYVLRNYMAQLAIDAADKGDYSIINELHEMLKQPYAEQMEYQKWFAKRPEWARHKVGCSMLSCSS